MFICEVKIDFANRHDFLAIKEVRENNLHVIYDVKQCIINEHYRND